MKISSSPTSGTETPEIDLAVKGSLPIRSAPSPSTPPITSRAPPAPPSNPLDTAPSSPSQVYLNLLILEASLRSQYLHHLSRRRKFTFFLFLLTLWIAFFVHRIYFLGGSPYYYISHLEWLGLLGGSVTATLYYATGLYQKTIVEPRRFVYTANRGLRGFNVKLVKVPFSTREWIAWWWNWYTFHPPPPPRRPPSTSTRRLSATGGPKPRRLSASTRRPVPPVSEHGHGHRHTPSLSSIAMGRTSSLLTPHAEEATEDAVDDEVEEYLPGGLHLKLVILPKRFSADFREGWELYRTEYWERENEARALRRKDCNYWRIWPRLKGKDDQEPPVPVPPLTASPAARTRRASIVSERRSPSVSSRAGTPEPEASTSTGRRRSGSFATKRRPNMAPGLVLGSKSDVSDSASIISERRSPSISSRGGTPEPEAVTPGKRRSGSFATKRRPNMAPGLVPSLKSGDGSDSGSIISERRSPSVSSRAGTPEPDTASPAVKRRSGSFATKRRPNMAPGLVSDSGSTAVIGERSESPVTDRSSSSAGTGKLKPPGKGRGRGRKSVIAEVAGDGDG